MDGFRLLVSVAGTCRVRLVGADQQVQRALIMLASPVSDLRITHGLLFGGDPHLIVHRLCLYYVLGVPPMSNVCSAFDTEQWV